MSDFVDWDEDCALCQGRCEVLRVGGGVDACPDCTRRAEQQWREYVEVKEREMVNGLRRIGGER